jgi:hypothetical protein
MHSTLELSRTDVCRLLQITRADKKFRYDYHWNVFIIIIEVYHGIFYGD